MKECQRILIFMGVTFEFLPEMKRVKAGICLNQQDLKYQSSFLATNEEIKKILISRLNIHIMQPANTGTTGVEVLQHHMHTHQSQQHSLTKQADS